MHGLLECVSGTRAREQAQQLHERCAREGVNDDGGKDWQEVRQTAIKSHMSKGRL
jgi:hypothetical protein